ncbi:hypothetical protein CJP46_02950 [Paenibacillus sp. XY044]|nr:hypothetical protein CJP46_02950 [Paenibacillus sp. XY044]
MDLEKQLFDRVVKFMIDNGIKCDEYVAQSDHVIENAYEFIEDLFNIVEPRLPASFLYADV